MRSSEFLTELFQPGKDWKWSFTGKREADAVFYVGKIPYKFHAECEDIYGEGPWEVEFKNASRDTSGRTEKFGLTGTGNSAEVMSVIVDIMRAFIEKYKGKITELVFSAKEDSRQGLYARMAKRLLPDWELQQTGESFVLLAPDHIDEEVLDEMPLPTDWDPQQFQNQNTSFKSRLAYALERAKKLGTGSSRVAMTIEYQGRPTVLKVAKNGKGLAQNSVEADILSDGYASQLGILIPIIDYDEQNSEPSWVHTELAQKASEKQLCAVMGCADLVELISMAKAIAGKLGKTTHPLFSDMLRKRGRTDQQIETMTEYANMLVDLNNSFMVIAEN